MYNECFWLGCSNDKVDDNVNGNVNQGTCFADDNVNQGTCFADDNVNDNVNDNDNDNDNDNVNDNDNDNDIDKDNDLRSGSTELFCKFTDLQSRFPDKVDISPPRNNNPIAININNDLQSWLNDDDIITEAEFPDNFICIISGPSECGKTFFKKNCF